MFGLKMIHFQQHAFVGEYADLFGICQKNTFRPAVVHQPQEAFF